MGRIYNIRGRIQDIRRRPTVRKHKRLMMQEYRRMNAKDRRRVEMAVGALVWLMLIVAGALLGLGIYLLFRAIAEGA